MPTFIRARLVLLLLAFSPATHAADWPQFMRDPAHTGDAPDESLTLPLGLVAQVKLDDAVMTAPAIAAGRVYVVDQMGTAYCIEPDAGRIIWKVSPDGAGAMGSNTSSPCVVKGRVCYATTAGNLHVLDSADGKVVKTVRLGSPVISAVTAANDAIYLQALDGIVRSFDLDGNLRWQWNHYKRYAEPDDVRKSEQPKRGHPGSYERPHYGGGEVAVSGTRVITSIGWDLVCLEDKGKDAELAWCRRCPAGRDGAIPMSSSASAGHVFTAGMGADGVLALMRFALADGASEGGLGDGAFPWITPAVRADLATSRANDWLKDEIQLADFTKRRSRIYQDPKSATPIITSHTLTKDHCVATTFYGELLVIDLAPKPKAEPFRFKTPNGKPIGSSPAVAAGRVFFGCDDGCLYVLGPGGKTEPVKDEKLALHERRSKTQPATGKAYGWASTNANAANTNFVDDPALKPPLRLRWAARDFGHHKTPCVATEDGDLITVTLGHGLVTCLEQMTGRLRWRIRLPGEGWAWANSSGMLAADGRLYVPRPTDRGDGRLFCVDLQTGAVQWSSPIGVRHIWSRASPVLAAGKVAFASLKKTTPPAAVVEAWDARTGEAAWKVDLNVTSGVATGADGCASADIMYFTAGAEQWGFKPEPGRKRGETVAIDAKSGNVLWRSDEFFGTSDPFLVGDRLFVNEHAAALFCLSAKDGKLLWKAPKNGCSRFSVGDDFIVLRGYGGGAAKLKLSDGTGYPGLQKGGQLGADAHACGPVALTPNISVAVSVAGLHVRDAKTGALLWLSPGFAPRACVNPTLANGRVFFPAAANGTLYCWEPETPQGPDIGREE